MSLANLKGQRTRLAKKISQSIESGQKLLTSTIPDENLDDFRESLEAKLTMCNALCTRYETISARIVEVMDGRDEEELEAEGEASADVVMEITELLSKLSARKTTVVEKIHSAKAATGTSTGVSQDQLQKLLDMEIARESRNNPRQSINLPKLDFDPFSGDVLKWCEFWDSFAASIHLNTCLQPVQKLAYLRTKLKGDAKAVIAGMETTSENCEVALGLLRERFGDEQTAISAHYSELMDLQASPDRTDKLRSMWDALERHLRCLASLGEDVNHRHFISMIMHKLPKAVIIKLEGLKGPKEAWSVDMLRSKLHCHLTARETADRQGSTIQFKASEERGYGNYHRNDRNYSFTKDRIPAEFNRPLATAEALVAEDRSQSSGSRRQLCVFCSGSHWSDDCRNFPTVALRKRQLTGRCFNCLNKGHSISECRSERSCWYCKKKYTHHRSLCLEKFATRREGAHFASEDSTECLAVPKTNNEEDESSHRNSNETFLASGEHTLLQTAIVKSKVQGSNKFVNLRVLFDSGSNITYISEEAVRKLKLELQGSELISVSTFGARKSKVVQTRIVEFSMEVEDGSKKKIVGNVVPQIAGKLQRRAIQLQKYRNVLNKYKLADIVPSVTEETSIDVMIGNDYYLDLLTFEKVTIDKGLYLLGSRFGWILTGRLPEVSRSRMDVSLLILNVMNQSVEALQQFNAPDKALQISCNTEDLWKLETIGIKETSQDPADEAVIDNFDKTIKFEGGRYFVTWPWKEQVPDLPSNYDLSLGRLKSLLRRLSSDVFLLQKYNKIIQEQEQKGIIEVAKENSNKKYLKHYIPHHAIVKPQKATTKVRIVFDASAKTRKDARSLNECLSRGPIILENLCGLLMRFRLHKIAFIADIEKAFLQVGLQSCDRDVTRFLWLKDPSKPTTEDNVQVYRFCRVPFGVISSPFLLGATVSYHLRRDGSQIANKISKNMYVDNLITGVETDEEAKNFYITAKNLFNSATMNLREWNSSSKEFLNTVPVEDRSDEVTTKVLGLVWNTSTDCISVPDVTVCEDAGKTKRNILKTIANFFDPLGMYSPALIRAKMRLQELWMNGYSWDDRLPPEFVESCNALFEDIGKISQLSIPRCIAMPDKKSELEFFLFCFCDASAKTYATVVYLGIKEPNVKIQTSLIFAKSRLAPTKRQTIPRLELMAVLIGARSLKFVEDQLRLPHVKKLLWTDSQCVLHWIVSQKKTGVFVDNRINEIQQHEDITYHYVESSENPADLPTRGVSVDELSKSELWWKGPGLLQQPSQEWKQWHTQSSNEQRTRDTEASSVLFEASLLISGSTASTSSPFGISLSRYSCLQKLLHVTAWCLRFIKKTKRLTNESSSVIVSVEVGKVKLMWEQYVQSAYFPDVFRAISSKKKHILRDQLDLYVDDKEILRCGGRLDNIDAPYGTRFPKLLPNDSPYTQLVIQEVHESQKHAGVAQTLSKVREEYWIPRGRRKVQTTIRNCLVCRRHEGGPYKAPPMPSLPPCCISVSVPFSYTGIDYFGPLYVSGLSKERSKVWVCLFTCMTIRAVHLELVLDLTAEEFLLSFRRFISRRGSPREIYSDNATNFKAASNLIDDVWIAITRSNEVAYASSTRIVWNFITPMAPWMGGFYERTVGLVKRCLRKSIGRLSLSAIQLQTVLAEIEAVINSRPLTYVSDDPKSGFVLTQSHFLCLNPEIGCQYMEPDSPERRADPDYRTVPNSSHERLLISWKKGNRHVETFWKIWRNEYLLSLRERFKLQLTQPRSVAPWSAKVNDVVLIKDEALPRGSWRFGKVLSIIISRDGQSRAAQLLLPSHREVIRPLTVLFPIECPDSTKPGPQPSIPLTPQTDKCHHDDVSGAKAVPSLVYNESDVQTSSNNSDDNNVHVVSSRASNKGAVPVSSSNDSDVPVCQSGTPNDNDVLVCQSDIPKDIDVQISSSNDSDVPVSQPVTPHNNDVLISRAVIPKYIQFSFS